MDLVRSGDPVTAAPRTLRRPRVALAVASLALAAGCSSGTSQHDVPEGFAAVEGVSFRLLHPQSWEVAGTASARVQAAGAPAEGGIAPAITATLDERFDGDFDTAVDGVLALAQLQQPQRVVVGERAPDIAGAVAARLVESTWVAEGDDGTDVAMRQWDLFTVDEHDELVVTTVNGPASALDADAARALLAGFTRIPRTAGA